MVTPCNLRKLILKFLRATHSEILREYLRFKIQGIFREDMKEIAAKIPPLTRKDFALISDCLDRYFHEHKDITETEFKQFMDVFPLTMVALTPEIREDRLKILFEVVLEEVRDHHGILPIR